MNWRKKARLSALAVIVVLCTGAPASQSQDIKRELPEHFVRCTPTKKLMCAEGECKDVPATTFYLLGKNDQGHTYSRCDRQGCDTYKAAVQEAGLHENWQLTEPRGVLFKRELTSRQPFAEVATLGLQVYVSFGQCKAVGE